MIDLEKLDELRSDAEFHAKTGRAWSASALDVIDLLDHIAALEKDAGRYKWLRDETDWEPFDSSWLIEKDIYGCSTRAMDVAIDTAMESNHG